MNKLLVFGILSITLFVNAMHGMDSVTLNEEEVFKNLNRLLTADPKDFEIWNGSGALDVVDYTPEQKKVLVLGIISGVKSIEKRGESDESTGTLGINLATLQRLPQCQSTPQQPPEKPTLLQKIAVPTATGIVCLGIGYLLATKLQNLE